MDGLELKIHTLFHNKSHTYQTCVISHPFPSQELVLGLMLGVSRSIPSAHDTMRRGEWAKKNFNGHTLNGKILGIIGFGSVGQAVSASAHHVLVAAVTYDAFLLV